MKQLYRLRVRGMLWSFLVIAFSGPVTAQVQTARYITIDANCNGFYEYLPEGYDAGSGSYPLMVFLHGLGELGNGTTDLAKVLANGPPKLIAANQFPTSFVVNGKTFRFIVISPQFIAWPAPADVDAVVNYAIQHYRVDPTRVYLTGLSMGGGATWDYAGISTYVHKLAAILPVSGASSPSIYRANVIAAANLPVWATHNQDDPTVPSSYTIDYVNEINSHDPPPSPLAKITIFPVSGHDAWTQTYDPNWRPDGLNVYEWMLQYQLGAQGPLPVVLSMYKAYLSGPSAITIAWHTSLEAADLRFVIERSTDGSGFTPIDSVQALNLASGASYSYTDRQPLDGNNYYRLTLVNQDGSRKAFSILEVKDNPEGSFLISPNPVGDMLHLELNGAGKGPVYLSIVDITGKTIRREVYQKEGFQWQQSVDVSSLVAGLYTVRITEGAESKTTKFVKQ